MQFNKLRALSFLAFNVSADQHSIPWVYGYWGQARFHDFALGSGLAYSAKANALRWVAHESCALQFCFCFASWQTDQGVGAHSWVIEELWRSLSLYPC